MSAGTTRLHSAVWLNSVTSVEIHCCDTNNTTLTFQSTFYQLNKPKLAQVWCMYQRCSIRGLIDFQQMSGLLRSPSVLAGSHSRCDNVWQVLEKKTQIKCGNQMDNRRYHSLIGHYRHYWFKRHWNASVEVSYPPCCLRCKHMSFISFNVFMKQAIYWTKYSGNVTTASCATLTQCVSKAASKFASNGCLAGPQRTRRTQVKCFSSGWC